MIASQLAPPLVIHPAGLIVANGMLARAEFGGTFPLVAALQERGVLRLGADELPDFLATLYSLPEVPALELSDANMVSESRDVPVPCVSFAREERLYGGAVHWLTLSFLYGNTRVAPDAGGATMFDRTTLTVHHRDRAAEAAAHAQLMELGARTEWNYRMHAKGLSVKEGRLMSMVTELSREGWLVDADGTRYRLFTATRAAVRTSG